MQTAELKSVLYPEYILTCLLGLVALLCAYCRPQTKTAPSCNDEEVLMNGSSSSVHTIHSRMKTCTKSSHTPTITSNDSNDIPYYHRASIRYTDLLDEDIRASPHPFNVHLHEQFRNEPFVRVEGEESTYLAFRHDVVERVLADHKRFSSNPFSDDRLVAPNTMSHERHQIVFRAIRKFYSKSALKGLEPVVRENIHKITEDFVKQSEADVMDDWARKIIMTTACILMGIPEILEDELMMQRLINFSDLVVKLVAPVGGIGPKIVYSWRFFRTFIVNMFRSIIPTYKLIQEIGFSCAWTILRPDTLIPTNARPRPGIWFHSEYLPQIPQYFSLLNELYVKYGLNIAREITNEFTNHSLNPLVALGQAEEEGLLSRAEVLVTIVQLQVNMTASNAIANMFYRYMCLETKKKVTLFNSLDPGDELSLENVVESFLEECLRYDASLQRLPRRVVIDPGDTHPSVDSSGNPVTIMFQTPLPENATILLMLGAANLDPAVFGSTAFDFDMDRFRLAQHDGRLLDLPQQKSLVPKRFTFGHGIHKCLGYDLVHLEMRLALEALIEITFHRYQISLGDVRRMTDIDVGNYGFEKFQVLICPTGDEF